MRNPLGGVRSGPRPMTRECATHAQRLWNLFGTLRIESSMIVSTRSENNAEKQRLSWYSWVDSNHRPPDPQSGALNQLSYSCTGCTDRRDAGN